MKLKFLLLCSVLMSTETVLALDGCFIAKENGGVIQQDGECNKRYSPCSTFKIALALMGFDAGILKDEMQPQWDFKPEYQALLETWKEPQNPTSWMKNSCVWYSQVLTPQLGIKKLQSYVNKFNYGNQDLTGDIGKNNGLKNAWLSSSLEISPDEQAKFLETLLSNQLPVSQHAHNVTKEIVYNEELPNGWKLYGKTGSGFLLNKERTLKTDIKHGWFIGWISKDDRKIIFVNHIIDDKVKKTYAGPRAKEQAKEKLLLLVKKFS